MLIKITKYQKVNQDQGLKIMIKEKMSEIGKIDIREEEEIVSQKIVVTHRVNIIDIKEQVEVLIDLEEVMVVEIIIIKIEIELFNQVLMVL